MSGKTETRCEPSQKKKIVSRTRSLTTIFNSYIILEYCDSKDMFSWINKYGPLSEHDTVYVFRQMMCAMEYCHSFNICHRDLKPENILLSDLGEVKIIDFGMAALHQNDQKLRTSCGSPHYAAPELLKSRTYRGDKADVWSMGVILFAMLAQRLPFDDPHLPTMLSMSKRAIYEMPEHFSPEAQDLIRRVLVTEPEKRISIREMWEHPLIKKYDGQPGFENHRKQPVDIKAKSREAAIKSRDIDPQILRQLRAMWHLSDVKDIKAKLTSKGPNEQKVFYLLLVAHRDRLLEDYDPGLTYSASDYHHLRPQAWATRVSTRQFNTHGRTPSRFTVISTVADTDAGGTVRSYDPYNASRNLAPQQASHARITVHPGNMDIEDIKEIASGSLPSKVGTVSSQAKRKTNSSLRSRTVSYAQSQRSSMSSIHSNRQGPSGVLVKRLHRRGVDFSSVRKAAVGPRRWSMDKQKRPASASIADGRSTRGERAAAYGLQDEIKLEDISTVASMGDVDTASPAFDEDLVRFSHSIAEACDDAFRSSLIASSPDPADRNIRSSLTPFTIEFGAESAEQTPEPMYNPRISNPWDSRPLPPTPPIELTPSPLRRNKVKLEEIPYPYGTNFSAYGGNSDMLPAPTSGSTQRRVTSAPVYAQYTRESRPLPSIYEHSPAPLNIPPRVVSAPATATQAPLPTPNDNKNLEFLANAENTIRIVESPTAKKSTGSAVVPQPLRVLKKSPPTNLDLSQGRRVSQELNTPRDRYNFHSQLPDLAEEPASNGRSSSNGSSVGPKKKLSTWFRRTSKASSKDDVTETPDTSVVGEDQSLDTVHGGPPHRFASTSTAAPPNEVTHPSKKKSLMFWKTPKNEQHMSIAGTMQPKTISSFLFTPETMKLTGSVHLAANYDEDSQSSDPERTVTRAGTVGQGQGDKDDCSARKIETHQNWLARLFRVKPAMRFLCLQISGRRARQEVTILLREWRKWGMRDIEVDKERNIVFARVGKKNCKSPPTCLPKGRMFF